ncbi:hypothetical protein KY495_23385 [Massilia sp. PAMC28688]|uniref:hypothetical protein n=1 Tax=Massilia sp. PAMC28688 TaxID=2861283 RepID=UPI001C63B347|nr:hypothetical protein [Massilia sp. PAMC28688]QYF93564.1 hypothetical protein KY495_23385 [Massilia sp. PAMC28688]
MNSVAMVVVRVTNLQIFALTSFGSGILYCAYDIVASEYMLHTCVSLSGTHMAESASPAPVPAAQGKTNTTGQSQIEVKVQACQFYFRPETAEVICVPEKLAGPLQAHALEMAQIVQNLQDANEKVTKSVEAYGEAVKSRDPQKVQKSITLYERAQQFLEKVHAIFMEKTKDLELAKLDANGTTLMELLPIAPGGPNGKGKQFNRKIVHVKSNHPGVQGWRAFPIDRERASASSQRRNVAGSQSHENDSIFARDPATGRRTLDHKKMMKQISAIKPEIKAEFIKFDDASFNGIIEDWALSWNYKKKDKGLNGYGEDRIDTSREAQTMRYMAGVGAAGVYDPSGGKLGLKVEGRAEFAVAEGKAAIAFYAPHRVGWLLHFTSPTTGKVYPLGSIRAKIEAVLTGVAGASVVGELSSEIECSKLKIAMKGVTTPGAPPPTINPAGGPQVAEKTKITPAKVDVGAFAGVKADVEITGALQWLDPEDKEKEPEHKDFIKLAPAVSAMAGIGGSLKLEITYNNGKFVMIFQASLCLGPGARGKIGCETDALLIGKFICWVVYQLYCANYEFLAFISRDAFNALQNIQFLVIQSGKQAADFMKYTSQQIADEVGVVLRIMDKTEARDALATRILTDDSMLRRATPETKGMLLYQLTRHDKTDWVNPDNYQKADAFHNRKKAVLRVLQWVQTTREWNNVFQHMHPRGERIDGSHYGTVEKFMKLGYRDMDDDLERIKARLHDAPARGYAFAANNTMMYEMNSEDNPHYAMAAIHPLSSMDISTYA